MSIAQLVDRWEQGDPYERYVGRWSRRVAPAFLAWLAQPAGLRWLDVGCGTGALTAAILDNCAPSEATGVEPSDGFRRKASETLGTRARLLAGNGASIPLENHSVDVTVSGLVLNFIPDLEAALGEMRRVTAAGGTISAYVWDYLEGMQLMRYFWDAALELDPSAGDEGRRFPLCRPQALQEAFTRAGLASVEVAPIVIDTPFANFDDYWSPFLGGQGTAPTYVMAMSEEARARLRESLRARLPARPDGSIALTARAWAVRGTVLA
jgi:SAM-dependent methyltransferase